MNNPQFTLQVYQPIARDEKNFPVEWAWVEAVPAATGVTRGTVFLSDLGLNNNDEKNEKNVFDTWEDADLASVAVTPVGVNHAITQMAPHKTEEKGPYIVDAPGLQFNDGASISLPDGSFSSIDDLKELLGFDDGLITIGVGNPNEKDVGKPYRYYIQV